MYSEQFDLAYFVRFSIAGAIIFVAASASAQQNLDSVTKRPTADEHCEYVKASVVDAGFGDEARVTCDETNAYIHSDSFPSHPMMTGIVATNEQIPTPAEGYFAPISLQPVLDSLAKTRDSSIAIAVNGIPIFDYTAGGEMSQDDLYVHQPHLDTTLLQQLDECGGHTGRGDDYHYHEKPRCMIEQMENAGDDAIIAWGFDGFPIYGDRNPDGSEIKEGDLDVCNGQPDPVFGYRYHTSEAPPYIIQCVHGEVEDMSAFPRIGTTRPSGRPVDVENLEFDLDEEGFAKMSYQFRGENYYIQYAPTAETNCFDFEYKTVTNGGQIESGTHCTRVNSGPQAAMGAGGMGMGGER